jgi:hypothetical protein
MAGTFSKSNRPKRPGAYFAFQAKVAEPTLVNPQGVVALGFTHSWGPENTVVPLNSFGDFIAKYGQGGTTPPTYTSGYRSVRDTFKGEGLPGYGGAGQVLAYRIVGSAGAFASKVLQNSTPAAAITLTARYKGSYGGNITLDVVADVTDPTNKHNLVVKVENVEAERWVYAKTNIADLVAQINGASPYAVASASKWITATQTITGVALNLVAAQALAGGNDGSALVAGDYSAAQTALEPWRFSVMSFDNQVDPTILAAQVAWAQNLNSKGKRFMSVVGGAAAEAMSAAVTRSGTINDPNFVNVGGGTFTDPDYGDVSTAMLAPRVAGIIAQRGEAAEITFARLAGLTVKVGNTEADILAGLAGGVVAFSRDSNAQAPVRIELGITSYTTTTDVSRPYGVYSNVKFMRVMQGLETELTDWAESNVIGKMQVNAGTRDFVRGQMQARLARREDDGIILPGWSVSTDTNPPPSDTDNFIALVYAITLGRGVQQVLNTVVVG